MIWVEKVLDIFKLSSTRELESEHRNLEPTIYIPDMNWEQDTNASITKDGIYDLKNFSKHESDTVKHYYDYVLNHYPIEYQAMGLANEGYGIKYKPRYIIHEIIIQKYQYSEKPYDKLAVAFAYVTKGGYFVDRALRYYEECMNNISIDIVGRFLSFMPLNTYSIISKLYEHEHKYEQAAYYTKLQKRYGDPNNSYFDNRITELLEKQRNWKPKRNMKMSTRQKEFEEDVIFATKMFLETGRLPSHK